jgi:hypothetical protein
VVVWELAVGVTVAVVALALGALSVGAVVTDGATCIGTSGTDGTAVVIGFIGLTGDTGLDTFVGLVRLFTQVFALSTHGPKIG